MRTQITRTIAAACTTLALISIGGGLGAAGPMPKILVQALAVDPSNSAIVYAGTVAGLYRTIDAGKNWSHVATNLPRSDFTALAIHPAAPCTIYAGLDSHIENRVIQYFPTLLYEIRNVSDILGVSTDCGVTWTVSPDWEGRGVYELAFTSATPPTLLARVAVNSLNSSGLPSRVDDVVQLTPTGVNLVYTDRGSGESENDSAIAIDPADPCAVYVANRSAAIWKASTCAPFSWTRIGTLQPPGKRPAVRAIAVHPTNHSMLVGTNDAWLNCCAADGGIYRKADGGEWTAVLVTSFSIDAIAFAPGRGDVAYAADRLGIVYKSLDGGMTWAVTRTIGTRIWALAASQTPLFRAYAAGFGVVQPFGCHAGASAPDATVPPPDCAFSDPILAAGTTPIKAAHITDLRVRIDRLRARSTLPAIAWSDPLLETGVTFVRAQHLLELRQALADVYAAAGQPVPVYTDADLTAGTVAKSVHIIELRRGVEGLE